VNGSQFDERAEFREGLKQSIPFILSVFPYGIVVGTLGINNGGSPFDVMLQSTLFFAGASQTVMWELYGAGTPVWVIPLAIFAVNFRLVLYSAAIGRKLEPLSKPKMISALFLLQDIAMAVGMKRADSPRGLSYGHYMGINLVLYFTWLIASAVGIVFGQLIDDPRAVGMDMLVPVYFLLLVMGFRTKPNMALVFMVSAGIAALVYALVGSPYHIAAGGLSGMLAAALAAKPEPKHV
jgi:predicted branched-subunit amino acid permease